MRGQSLNEFRISGIRIYLHDVYGSFCWIELVLGRVSYHHTYTIKLKYKKNICIVRWVEQPQNSIHFHVRMPN